MDPNDCIYPIAFAVVEVESFVTWKWFLESLKDDLQGPVRLVLKPADKPSEAVLL